MRDVVSILVAKNRGKDGAPERDWLRGIPGLKSETWGTRAQRLRFNVAAKFEES